MAYINDDIKYKKTSIDDNIDDLPTMTFEVGLGRERKTLVNFFYREWKGGIHGISDQASQVDRLTRQAQHWKILTSQDRDLVILGDANLCAKVWNNPDYPTDKKELATIVNDFLLEESLVQTVNENTRTELKGNNLEKSCIDHIYVNCPNKCNETIVVPGGSSDHLAVMITKFSKEIPQKPKAVKKRTYKNFKETDFIREVKFTNFEEVLKTEVPEEATEIFTRIFTSIINNHAPMKIFLTRNNYAPWLSEETKRIMKERDRLKSESKESNDINVLKKYRKLRNQIKEINKKEEKEFYMKEFEDAGDRNDSRKMWGLSYDILGSKKNLSPNQLIIDGNLCSNPKLIAEEFNKIFINKVQKLKSELQGQVIQDPAERLQDWLKKRTKPIPELEFKEISEADLMKYVKKLKGNRSSGIDEIDSVLLKLAAPYLKVVLLHIVNLNIAKHFSAHWKTQLIRPNYKKADKLQGTNYRPVSNIPELSKVVEFAIFDQLLKHFIVNGLFHPNHHGFLPLHNTSTAVAHLYDLWLEAAEKQELSAALLLDLSAAFDLVDHSILLQKLKLYNLSDSSLKFMESYLSNRNQIVQVETKQSEPKEIGAIAVPQGSVLGGLLFLIFQNDFPENSNDGESVLYADDDTDTLSDPDPENLKKRLQEKANRSTAWYRDNGMVCSGDKTKLLILGTKELRKSRLISRNKSINITVCNNDVKESVSERLLGLEIKNDLTWSAHLYGNGLKGKDKTEGLITKLSKRVGMLKKVRKFMKPKQIQAVTQGLFTSKLTFGLQVFGNVWGIPSLEVGQRRFTSFTKEDNRRLQVLQNKVLRLRTRIDYNIPTDTLVKSSGELSVQQLTAYHTLTTVYKAVRMEKPVYHHEKLKPKLPNRLGVFPHRQANKITVQGELRLTQGGMMYRGAKLWNLLDQDLKNETSLPQFKRKVKKWISEKIPVKPP